jgi:predicted LPLAT superfamily acyltransferase
MTGHIGSWDMAAAALKNDGLDHQFHMVKYESQGITFDRARNQTDPVHVKKLISNEVDQPLLQIREILSRGQPVGLMGDRPLGNQFELVSFFGKLAPVDCTPFKIAAACDVPLLFTFGLKGKKNNYDFYASPSSYYRSRGGKEKLLQMLDWAQDFAKELEQIVEKYPEQWFNFFPFWSTPPLPPESRENTRARNYSREELHKPVLNRAASALAPNTSDELEFRP